MKTPIQSTGQKSWDGSGSRPEPITQTSDEENDSHRMFPDGVSNLEVVRAGDCLGGLGDEDPVDSAGSQNSSTGNRPSSWERTRRRQRSMPQAGRSRGGRAIAGLNLDSRLPFLKPNSPGCSKPPTRPCVQRRPVRVRGCPYSLINCKGGPPERECPLRAPAASRRV
jgi:hypothetical protein